MHFLNKLVYWIIFAYVLILFSLTKIVISKSPVLLVFNFIVVVNLIVFLLRIYGAEYIALCILIVYTGVVTVLFLFTLIIYQPTLKIKKNIFSFESVIILILLLVVLSLVSYYFLPCIAIIAAHNSSLFFYIYDQQNIAAIYNEYWVYLVVCGTIIFFSIIGSITLTTTTSYKPILDEDNKNDNAAVATI